MKNLELESRLEKCSRKLDLDPAESMHFPLPQSSHHTIVKTVQSFVELCFATKDDAPIIRLLYGLFPIGKAQDPQIVSSFLNMAEDFFSRDTQELQKATNDGDKPEKVEVPVGKADE